MILTVCPECERVMKYIGDNIYLCDSCSMSWSEKELRELGYLTLKEIYRYVPEEDEDELVHPNFWTGG